MTQENVVAEIVQWLRDVAEAEPRAPRAPFFREAAEDIRKRWATSREDEFKAMGLTWPKTHPVSGEAFVADDLERSRDSQVHHYLGPMPPSREVVTEWDGDEPSAWRELTDDEFAAAQAQYMACEAEFRRTGGVVRTVGPTTTRCTFRCANGDTAEGIWDGKAWQWETARVNR